MKIFRSPDFYMLAFSSMMLALALVTLNFFTLYQFFAFSCIFSGWLVLVCVIGLFVLAKMKHGIDDRVFIEGLFLSFSMLIFFISICLVVGDHYSPVGSAKIGNYVYYVAQEKEDYMVPTHIFNIYKCDAAGLICPKIDTYDMGNLGKRVGYTDPDTNITFLIDPWDHTTSFKYP